jgi:hypothetical protein
MATGDEGSVTRWLRELKAGDPAAAQRLWARYFADLVRLARPRAAALPTVRPNRKKWDRPP